jgi:hypothetical protein
MIGILYLLLVLALASLGIWIADRDFRIATLIILLGSFGTTLVYALTPGNWDAGMPLVLVIDLMATILLMWLAFESKHFWPLWLGGFQLGAIASHISISIALDAMPYAMGVLQGFWAWFQIMVLLGVALQHVRPTGQMKH